MDNDASFLDLLTKINDNLVSFKESIREEIHSVNLGMAAIKSDINTINVKLEPRIDRLEQLTSVQDHSIAIMKDDIHRHDLAFTKLEDLPQTVSKLRHRLASNEQHVLILQGHNLPEKIDAITQRVVNTERDISSLRDRAKGVDEKLKNTDSNTKTLVEQKAVLKFVQNKNVWTVVLFAAGTIAAYYGFGPKT